MLRTYQEFKDEGFTVFGPMAGECTHLSRANPDKPHYVIAVTQNTLRNEKVILLVTGRTQEEIPTKLQNLRTRLDENYGFVEIEVVVTGLETIRTYLSDAESLPQEESDNVNSDGGFETYSTNLREFAEICSSSIRERASDIHYIVNESSAKYVFRIDGKLTYTRAMNPGKAREMLSAALQACGKGFTGLEDDTKKIDVPIVLNVEVDEGGVKKLETVTLRLSRRGIRGGYKATFRVIRTKREHVSLATLGYPRDQENILDGILNAPYGIFLSTGPVGSGKTTANIALIESFDKDRGGMSLEDPIEYEIMHPNIEQFQVDGAEELAETLKASLRHDPNIIGVAEIRDERVAELTFGYSRVGTVMISTLHTNDAIGAFPRLLDLGISPAELASPDTFLGILNQRLLPVLCPACKIRCEDDDKGIYHRHDPIGCDECVSGKIPGRVAAAEILQPLVDDSPFILNQDWYGWREYLIRKGYKTTIMRVLELSAQGKVSWDDAVFIPHFKEIGSQLRWAQEGPLKAPEKLGIKAKGESDVA